MLNVIAALRAAELQICDKLLEVVGVAPDNKSLQRFSLVWRKSKSPAFIPRVAGANSTGALQARCITLKCIPVLTYLSFDD